MEEALRHAEAAISRCKRLLPHPWVHTLQGALPVYQEMLQSCVEEVQEEQSTCQVAAAGARKRTADDLPSQIARMGEHKARLDSSHACASCGQHAVGLRTCARCRTARYCSRECQAAHWPQHKRECRPA